MHLARLKSPGNVYTGYPRDDGIATHRHVTGSTIAISERARPVRCTFETAISSPQGFQGSTELAAFQATDRALREAAAVVQAG